MVENKSSKAKIEAQGRYQKKSCINKTIQFNLNTEADLIEYLSNLDVPFGTLVKDLLRKEMNGSY